MAWCVARRPARGWYNDPVRPPRDGAGRDPLRPRRGPLMSTAAPPRLTSRLWLPLLVLIAALLAGAAVWYWPSDWEHHQRSVTILALAFGSLVLLAYWALFLAREPHWLRQAAAVVVLGGVAVLLLIVRDI